MFARKKCISLHPHLSQNENVREANQFRERPVIAHFRHKRVIGARRSCPAAHPTKGVAGKLYREISILVIPSRQELSIRGPSAAA